MLILKLLENQRFCHLLKCYQNTLFFTSQDTFKITAEVKQVISIPKLYLSSTLLNTNQTTVQHNQLSTLEDDIIIPDHNDIPAIQQKQLFGTNIDAFTRKLKKDNLWTKLSFQSIQIIQLFFNALNQQS